MGRIDRDLPVAGPITWPGEQNPSTNACHAARRVAAVAPDAWVINFTYPAGVVTEAMAPWLGDRVIGRTKGLANLPTDR